MITEKERSNRAANCDPCHWMDLKQLLFGFFRFCSCLLYTSRCVEETVSVTLQTEQHTKSHVVNAAVHGTVHCLCVVIIVVFGSCGMQFQVALFVIGLLDQNIRTDSRLFYLAVIFLGRCGNVDVHTADSAVFVIDPEMCIRDSACTAARIW